MPAKVTKKGDRYRVTHGPNNALVKNRGGTPVDGGGHQSAAQAERQARAINRNEGTRRVNS